MSFDLRIDQDLMGWANKFAKEINAELVGTINKAAAAGIRSIKTNLGGRSGELRKSYRVSSPSQFSRLIHSPLKYADVAEFGRKGGKTIYPRAPRKRLTVPIKDSVLTASKSQISKPSLDRLFRRLKNRKKGETSWDIQQDVGILLLKKAKMSTIKPSYKLRDRVLPDVDRECTSAIKAGINTTIEKAK